MGDFRKNQVKNLEILVRSEKLKNGIKMLITPKLSEIQKIGPYLDNFLTNPYTFLAYSGDSGPKSPEYAKICMGLVTKLSRYHQI